ncbi:MFS transporter [Brachybacterium hainanense]|uniref:CynX/NimT family MFS transporter n=1 Tax=Brachybacterium hainanense TaxID=1541174 RepID=A0ABV6RE14_9MICO
MTPPTEPSTSPPRRTVLLWAGLAIGLTALNLRTAVTGFTPLLEIIGRDLGYGLAMAGLLGTVPAAAFGVFGAVAPVVTGRFGLERTATAALAATALALVLRAAAPSPGALVGSTVLALAGIGAANVVIVPLVKSWFPNRLALWTSLYLILMQTGQFLAPLLAVPLADAGTWRLSVGIWAGPALLAAISWCVLAVRAPTGHHARTASATRPDRSSLLVSPTLWGLAVLFAMMSVSNYAVITWVPAILVEAGADPALGGAMVALYSSWGMLAALLVPRLTARMPRPFPIVLACGVLLVAGYLGLLLSPLVGTLVWVCALGIGVSTFPLCMTLINLRTSGPQAASATSGIVQGIGYGIACLGPVGLGLLHEATGSWTVPLLVLAATTVPGIIGGWFACRPIPIDGRTVPGTCRLR